MRLGQELIFILNNIWYYQIIFLYYIKQKNMAEIKKHPVFTDYGADLEGNVYSFKCNKLKERAKVTHGRGYHHFSIWITKQHKSKMYLVHRFVYECFHGIIPQGLQINHIDLDKQNNQLDNLEVVDQWMNMQHGIENGVLYGSASPNHPNFYR